MSNITNANFNPDVLNCIANLSNDEVFTSPKIANQMLDLLPEDIWKDRNAKFLDPFTKSGVFLREITKRLLNAQMPNYEEMVKSIEEKEENDIPLDDNDNLFQEELQKTIDHILHNQVYGIAITELTSLLARRSVYCSKYPKSKYSVSKFDTADGNIRFKKVKHTWKDGKCVYCGASQEGYDRDESLETYAYEFIHVNDAKEIYKDMKFDVIIGNPPYQLSDGGAQASAKPIYHLFIESAKKLNPRYITMITPSRWFSGGKGLDDFRKSMLQDDRLTFLHDFPNASDCFSGVEIKGGVSYFLWSRDKHSDCTVYTHSGDKIISKATRPLLEKSCDVFIRNNELVSIYKKVQSFKETSFSNIVSPLKPYGLRGDFFKDPKKYSLPSVFDKPVLNGVTIWGLDSMKRISKYVGSDYPFPKKEYLKKYKMFMARNQGSGLFGETFSTPIFAGPNEACTETFVVIGLFETEKEMKNCWTYMKTKFFRTMVGVKKNDQGMAQGVYQYVPMQDFSKPWTDEELYKKYNLTQEEIDFIESTVKPINLSNDGDVNE